jgi:nitroimidazol reductase NimA-like FMN-containing flavoprotein (pyridoxamine 5'-phosphate oxidase superfamily)
MVMEFSEAETKFLNVQEVGRLATVSPKNRAQVTPIIYVFDDGVFYFTTMDMTKKFSNMKNNPNVGLAIDIYEEGGHKRQAVVVQGTSEEVEDDEEFERAKKMLTDKLAYYQVNPIVRGTNHLFRISPEHKVSWGL